MIVLETILYFLHQFEKNFLSLEFDVLITSNLALCVAPCDSNVAVYMHVC